MGNGQVRIHVLGFPGEVGGASTELWHTLLMWRATGADVTVTPTWSTKGPWRNRVESIGCRVVEANSKSFAPVPGVPIVTFCNSQLFAVIKRLDQSLYPCVWVPCMNYLTDREIRRYDQGHLPAAVVCQSDFQLATIGPDLRSHGMRRDQLYRIRGAFDVSAYPFRPKEPSREFIVGRISRADSKKFRPDLWQVLDRVRQQSDRPLRVRILGWHKRLAKSIGEPPAWAECHEPGSLNAYDFMRSLDVLYQSGECTENWPRVGLEAMANGTPLVVDNQGGWPEILDGGRLGYLVGSADEAVDALTGLADRSTPCNLDRLQTIHRARQAMESRLSSNHELWQQWVSLFREVSSHAKQPAEAVA